MNLKDRTVMVTGAAGNLGRAVAQRFAAKGAQLVLVDLSKNNLQQVYPDSGLCLLVETNVMDSDDVQVATESAIRYFGKIDIVCNVAGGFQMGKAVHETSTPEWESLMSLNAGSVVNVARAVVPHMLAAGYGKIVNVGAFVAQYGAAYMSAYVAAKNAVVRLTESMAVELREKNINVNCVLPTIIDTPANRVAMPDADPSRWVAPADVADAIFFLVSDRAKAIHGASLAVRGLS